MKLNAQIKSIVTNTPIVWGIFGILFFWHVGGLLDKIGWNAIEIMIGKNLLSGNGYIVAPLDPPAIWRPVFIPFLCALTEIITKDPKLIFRIIYTISLTNFIIWSFYILKIIHNKKAGHICCFLIMSCPALTYLIIGGAHTFSHIGFLLIIGPAIYFTFRMIIEHKTIFGIASGILWGLIYLTRPETIVFFICTSIYAISICLIAKKKNSFLEIFFFFFVSFLIFLIPYELYLNHVRSQYNIIGQMPIVTFYNSEGWARELDGDTEAAGYGLAIKFYGPIESNKFNVLRAIIKNKSAFFDKLRINLKKFYNKIFENNFFNPMIIIFALFPFISFPIVRKPVKNILYFAILFGGSHMIAIFHIDSRYLIITIPSLLFLGSSGLSIFFELVSAVVKRFKAPKFIGTIAFLFMVLLVANFKNNIIEIFKKDVHKDIEIGKGLADAFIKNIRGRELKVLSIIPPSNSRYDGVDMFLVSYYANTALEWGSSEIYPRDKIFSFVKKNPDYVYLPEEKIYQTDILLKAEPILEYLDIEMGKYFLFGGSLESLKIKDINQIENNGYRKLYHKIGQKYPELKELLEMYYAKSEIEKTLSFTRVKNNNVDKVGCAELALRGDKKTENLFLIEFMIPKEIMRRIEEKEYCIEYIELLREKPAGINRTAPENFILGVFGEIQSDLINKSNGSIEIAIKRRSKLYLAACADGFDSDKSIYECRIRIGKDLWISSRKIKYERQ
jgi:hypothetical protein